MKKTNRIVTMVLLGAAIGATPAQAQSNSDICTYYGNVGASAIDFLLPLKFSQVVNMIAGKDKDLLEAMTKAVENKGSNATRKAVEKLGDDAVALMGEAAGFHGFQLVMTGQASSGKEVFGLLTNQCLSAGPEAIIESQRKARAVQTGEES